MNHTFWHVWEIGLGMTSAIWRIFWQLFFANSFSHFRRFYRAGLIFFQTFSLQFKIQIPNGNSSKQKIKKKFRQIAEVIPSTISQTCKKVWLDTYLCLSVLEHAGVLDEAGKERISVFSINSPLVFVPPNMTIKCSSKIDQSKIN